MFDQLLSDGFVPFTLSLALLFGLLALELVFALLGGTLLGAGGDGMDGPEIDGPDIDGPDLDVPEMEIGDLDIDLDGLDTSDLELPSFADVDVDTDLPDGAAQPSGIAAWLGFGKMPALIWLSAILMAFGITGVVLQNLVLGLFGAALPALLAAIPAAVAAIFFARRFGTGFARLIPKTETAALSERHLGRRQGVITQGTAARGRPAEVKVTDRFGNTHYLRAEPLRDDAQIPQGTEVVVLRHRYEGGYFIVALSA
ncbi:DUF1449 family protein [Tropicibacter sp. R15_0]|uniref:OB-fold-containig protein n=1 Tax=Tropicibacter sp. R15_0 TaxID=2821101 RepID=UPI001ADD5302|nr:OB-fold-containig protein [Tropicibacter sp. R15_0]MBO9464025.1 DUF1449 family protein [Tropicibacter sp. R15_0]